MKFLTEFSYISTNTTIIVMYFRYINLNKNYIQKVRYKYIKKLLNFYKPLKIKVVGCSVFGKKYYEYCLESYLGISININKLENWANKELEKLIEQMIFNIKLTNIKLNNKTDIKSILIKEVRISHWRWLISCCLKIYPQKLRK